MISPDKYNRILEEGLLLDHYYILERIGRKEDLPDKRRIRGFINLLEKKGYIKEGSLTDKAIQLIGTHSNPGGGKSSPNHPLSGFAEWVLSLHSKCEEKLIEYTGKKQVRDKIAGKAYPFLPNTTDFARVLLKTINTYKLRDYKKIERTILDYIDRCARSKQWFPVLQYYIMKNGMSSMVTDMDSIDDSESEDTIVNI